MESPLSEVIILTGVPGNSVNGHVCYGNSLFVFWMDPCGKCPGNLVMCSPLAEADPVGGFPGNAATDSKKTVDCFLGNPIKS